MNNIKSLKFTLLFLIIANIFYSCKKDIKLKELDNPEINQIKTWFEDTVDVSESNRFGDMKPDWNSIYVKKESDKLIYEFHLKNINNVFQYDKSVNIESVKYHFDKNNIRLLVFKDINSGRIISGCYMSILNDGGSFDLKKIHYKKVNNLNGKILYYNTEGKFVNGWVYNNGDIFGKVSLVNSENYGSKMNLKISSMLLDKLMKVDVGDGGGGPIAPVGPDGSVTCFTESVPTYRMACAGVDGYMNCQWVIHGYDIISYCIDNSNNNGGGSNNGGDYSGSGGGGGGGGNSPSQGNSEAWPGDLKCSSFNFEKVGSSNSMSAVVTNLKSPSFGIYGSSNYRSFPLRNIVIDVPISLSTALSDGTKIITPGYAAEAAAEAANMTVKILGEIYGVGGKWGTAMDSTYELDFIKTMDLYLQANIPGSRVSVNGSRPVTPKAAIYSGFFDGLFDGGCN